MDYRQRLREVREDRDLSQAEVGKVLNKSQQGYSHIENGRAELKIEDLITLLGDPEKKQRLLAAKSAEEVFEIIS